jgi:hypothetical protein
MKNKVMKAQEGKAQALKAKVHWDKEALQHVKGMRIGTTFLGPKWSDGVDRMQA